MSNVVRMSQITLERKRPKKNIRIYLYEFKMQIKRLNNKYLNNKDNTEMLKKSNQQFEISSK